MYRTATEAEARKIKWQRRCVQAIFVAFNLVLIEGGLPGFWWTLLGAFFWITIIFITVTNGPVVCSWICWLGTAQDWAEPIAKRRIRLNPKVWRLATLIGLVIWAPASWLIQPETFSPIVTPFGLNADRLVFHLFQLGFFILVGLSVTLFGKRGSCIYFCPLLMVSRMSRYAEAVKKFRLPRLLGKPIVINTAKPNVP